MSAGDKVESKSYEVDSKKYEVDNKNYEVESKIYEVESKKYEVESKKYELVAPDGGWGYMICLSFILNISTATMFFSCFGMIFNDFMIEIGVGSTGVGILTGLNAFCYALAGFFTDSMLKIMSKRQLGLLAAVVMNAATIGTVFANSVATFFLYQGILPGLALGITFNLCFSIMNDYFDKKRMLANSVVQFLVALLTMVTPLFVKWSMEEYGYRGTLIIIAGVTLNNLLAVVLMQPVEWHMKRVEVQVTEESINPEIQPLFLEKESNAIIIKLSDTSTNDAAIEKSHDFIIESEKPSKLRKFVEAFIDIPFSKKFIFSCICVGPALSNFAEYMFGVILPQALYSNGWNDDMVALALSLYGFGDLAMRTVLIFTSKLVERIGSQEVFIIGLILATVSKLGMIWSEKAIPIYVYMVLMGIARCFNFVLVNMVISDNVAPEMFTQAMGISMMVSGGTILVIGPAIGAIRDLTNSYLTAFYILTSFFAIVILFWSIELVYKKNKEKRNTQKETQAKSNQSNKGK